MPFASRLVYIPKSPQTRIQNKTIVHVENQADIARLEVLLEFGGVYLDRDQIILRPPHIYRAASFAAFKEGRSGDVSNAVLFSRPQHEIPRQWLANYATYDGSSLYSHSIKYITKLSQDETLRDKLQVFGMQMMRYYTGDWRHFYNESCSLGESYGIHLHDHRFPTEAGVEFVKRNRSTFAHVARYILFNDATICGYDDSYN